MENKQELATKLIARFEGLKLHAYEDSGGIATIGIGTIKYPDGIRVKMGDTCTQEQAYEYLNNHLIKHVYPAVDDLCQKTDTVSDELYASLCSIAYNLGSGILQKNSFVDAISNNNMDALADTFAKYNKVRINGVLTFSKGLDNRRQEEIEYFKS